jgi:hypothetical protein
MWKLIFSLEDNRGVDFDRDPQAGEYARTVAKELCGEFRYTPSRYEWTGTAMIEFAGWNEEQAAKRLARKKKRMAEKIEDEENRRNLLPIEHPNGSGLFHKTTETIKRIIDRYADLADTDPFPHNNGKWDDADGNPVPITMGELKQLWNAIIDRGTMNYGVRKYHIKEMKKLADPETYDFSGGWA